MEVKLLTGNEIELKCLKDVRLMLGMFERV